MLWPVLANAAGDAVIGLRVVNDRWPDAGSPESFGRDAVRLTAAQSPEAEAIAVWRFIQQMTEVGTVPKEPAYNNFYVVSPEKLLNVYGVHWCDGLSRIMTITWRALGQRADKLYKFGHTLADIHYRDADGVERWHVFDLSQHWFVYDRTGSHIATADELALDHSLQYYPSRTPIPDKPSPMQPSWVHAGHLDIEPHPMELDLRTGQRIEFLFGNEDKPYMNLFPGEDRKDFEHGPYPITYGNGRLVTKIPVEEIKDGKIIPIHLPYVISDAFLDFSGQLQKPEGSLKISLSTDGGASWRTLWSSIPGDEKPFMIEEFDFCPPFDPEKTRKIDTVTPFGRYDYLLRVDSKDVSLTGLQVTTVFQHNLFALPMLWPGSNYISVKGDLAEGQGVRVTYRWEDLDGEKEETRTFRNLPARYHLAGRGEKWIDVRCRSLAIEPVDAPAGMAVSPAADEPPAAAQKGWEPYPAEQSIGSKEGRQPDLVKDIAKLERAMKKRNGSIVADRIVALGALQNSRSAEILKKVIFTDTLRATWHKVLACQALYQSVGAEAAPVMMQILEKDAEIAWAEPSGKWTLDTMWLHTAAMAAAILADIQDFAGKEEAADLIAATLEGKRTEKPMTDLHRGNEIGWGLIRDLGYLGGARHVGLLKSYLSGNADAAALAAEALLQIGNHELLDDYLALLSEREYPPLRLAAIQGIGQFGDPTHGEVLYPFLNHSDESFRGAAAKALGQLKDAQSEEHIKQALKKEHFSWVREIMKKSLERLGQLDREARVELSKHIDENKQGLTQ